MYALIGTWKMSLKGIGEGGKLLESGKGVADAIEQAVTDVEANPAFVSVGYGGLPALDGQVYLDAGFMDGDSLTCGAVLSVRDIASAFRAARGLCGRKTNWMLSGEAARKFAVSMGIPVQSLLTPGSLARYSEAMRTFSPGDPLTAYRGHDTVCVLGLDTEGHMASGTSTSGLFLKEPGRIGDSPIPGSGYYCDSRFGAAAATGLGEDIMRGCLSYEAVRLMREGRTAQQAAEEALQGLVGRKLALGEDKGSMSLITLASDGTFGAATTEACFPFAVALPDGTKLFSCVPGETGMILTVASDPDALPD